MKEDPSMKRWIVCLLPLSWAGLVLAAGIAGTVEDEGSLYLQGKKAFRTCAPCHCTTEPRLAEDGAWLKLLATTNCINAGEMTPKIRKALAVFFQEKETLRPLLVTEAYEPEEDLSCGEVRVPSTSGSAYLKADRDSIRDGTPPKVRLYWKASDAGKVLHVPAGRYRVINYRFYRTAEGDDAERWTLSVTDMNGCAEVVVEEGKRVEFPFRPVLSGILSAVRTREGLRVALGLRNGKASTTTLARGERISIPSFTVEDDAGRELFRAPFENT